jgi:hypothetical protein
MAERIWGGSDEAFSDETGELNSTKPIIDPRKEMFAINGPSGSKKICGIGANLWIILFGMPQRPRDERRVIHRLAQIPQIRKAVLSGKPRRAAPSSWREAGDFNPICLAWTRDAKRLPVIFDPAVTADLLCRHLA